MRKAFNKLFCENLINDINLKFYMELTKADIYNKAAYKKIKQKLSSLKAFKYILRNSSKENKINILKKYWPAKCATLSENFEVMNGAFRPDEKKIAIEVKDGERIRTFLLKTKDIERIKPEIENILNNVKNKLDKAYGLFYNEQYITDMNITKNGYRVIDKNINNYYIMEE